MKTFVMKTIANGLKIVAAAAVLVAVGWAVLTLAPESDGGDVTIEVKDSQADIWSVIPVARTSTQKFTAALESLGHETPKMYDYNGSTVFFSPRRTDLGPPELLVEYQQRLHEYGVNEEPYIEMNADALENGRKWKAAKPDLQKRNLAMLSGQIVPLYVGEKYINMGGAVLAGEPETTAEAEKYLTKTDFSESDWRREFSAFRSIEGFRAPDDKKTWVSAVWAEPGLDMRNHIRREGDDPVFGGVPDADVPSCPGCTRSTRFAEMDPNGKDYVTNIFMSPQHFKSVENFYRRSLTNRGWKETDSSALTSKALQYTTLAERRERMLQFAREDRFLTLHIYPDQNGGAMVTTTKTD